MRCLITALCSLLLSTQAPCAQPAILLGPDLEPVSVQLKALSPEAIVVVDDQGGVSALKPEAVLRLTMSRVQRSTSDSKRSVLTLRDGQVLVGRLVASNDEEAVRLKLDNDRVAQVPLDELLSLAVQAGAKAPLAEDDDALLLATGEVLLGFVETFSEDAVGFVVGDADDAIQIPLERIKALSIANKPTQPEAKPGTVRVTTSDGSVLLVQDATLSQAENAEVLVGVTALPILSSRRADEGLSTAASSRLALPMAQVASIEPVSTRVALVPLTDLDWQVTDGGEVFGVAMPPRIAPDGSVRMHAPVAVGFDLPEGASRLAFTIAMDLDETIPESRRQMAGCELIVYEGDNAIARHTLRPEGPPKRINVALSGGVLRIALASGVNGPVLDRVVLTDAELLVSE